MSGQGVGYEFTFFKFFLNIFFSSYNVWKHVRYPAANQGDNTVSVAQGGTATPGATEQLLPPDIINAIISYWLQKHTHTQTHTHIYIYIYIYIYLKDMKKEEK